MPLLSRIRTDSGAVTAEFAVALPAVLAMLVLAVSTISGAALTLESQQLAGLAIRALSQGDPESKVRQLVGALDSGTELHTSRHDGVLCVEILKRPRGALSLLGYQPRGRACTWIGAYFDQ